MKNSKTRKFIKSVLNGLFVSQEKIIAQTAAKKTEKEIKKVFDMMYGPIRWSLDYEKIPGLCMNKDYYVKSYESKINDNNIRVMEHRSGGPWLYETEKITMSRKREYRHRTDYIFFINDRVLDFNDLSDESNKIICELVIILKSRLKCGIEEERKRINEINEKEKIKQKKKIEDQNNLVMSLGIS